MEDTYCVTAALPNIGSPGLKAYIAELRPDDARAVKVYVKGHRGAWLPRRVPLRDLRNIHVERLHPRASIARCRWIVTSADTDVHALAELLRTVAKERP